MIHKEDNKRICQHCKPIIASPNHYKEKIFIYLDLIFGLPINLLENIVLKYSFGKNIEGIILCWVFKILSAMRIINFVSINADSSLFINRTMVVCKEAKKRGYIIRVGKILGLYMNIFELEISKRKIIFQSLPLIDFFNDNYLDFDDKYLLKLFFIKNRLPFVAGDVFKNVDAAVRYGKMLGFPLVVKPRRGSLSRHTIVNISNEDDLREAIKIVKKITNEFIVEKFISGKDYRIILVDGKIVGCALREPPNIVGDGTHTIEELIQEKNNNPLRGEKHQKNFTIKKIDIDDDLKNFIMLQGFSFSTVLEEYQKIYLNSKIVLASGADIHDVTNLLHPKNVELFERIGSLLKAPIIGFDIVMPCVSMPYDETLFGIIEANGSPYIDMHHFPVSGESRDVASAIFDVIERQINS